jgi:hypothetical protein
MSGIPRQFVEGLLLGQIETLDLPDLGPFRLIDEKPPCLACVASDDAEVLAGHRNLHHSSWLHC